MREKGVYAIKIKNKVYVGQDSKIYSKSRIKDHLRELKRNNHNNKEMQSDFNKFGIESVHYKILDSSPNYNSDDLNKLEIYYINKLNTFDSKFGYNKTLGGIGMLGYKQSDETIEKRIKNQRGEGNPMSKITNEQFFKMVEMFKAGESNASIANEFGLHDRYVSLIRHKKRFKHLWNQVEDYTPTQSHKIKDSRKINFENFMEIVEMIEKGETNAEIQRKFNLSNGAGSRIRHKKIYKDYWERYEKEYIQKEHSTTIESIA